MQWLNVQTTWAEGRQYMIWQVRDLFATSADGLYPLVYFCYGPLRELPLTNLAHLLASDKGYGQLLTLLLHIHNEG